MNIIAITLSILAASFTLPVPSTAAATVSYAPVVESRFFTIDSYPDLDTSGLLTKLEFEHFLGLESILNEQTQGEDVQGYLSSTIDVLFKEISEILGLELREFHGKIQVCPNEAELQKSLKKLYGLDFEERSIYIHEVNTIFISYEDMTLGMLGHEIAHAIISHYFVVPPPAKVQEVLAGYVEYSLRKTTATLPKKE